MSNRRQAPAAARPHFVWPLIRGILIALIVALHYRGRALPLARQRRSRSPVRKHIASKLAERTSKGNGDDRGPARQNACLRNTITQLLESHPEPRAAVKGVPTKQPQTRRSKRYEPICKSGASSRADRRRIAALPGATFGRPQPSRTSRRSSTRALEGATASGLLPYPADGGRGE